MSRAGVANEICFYFIQNELKRNLCLVPQLYLPSRRHRERKDCSKNWHNFNFSFISQTDNNSSLNFFSVRYLTISNFRSKYSYLQNQRVMKERKSFFAFAFLNLVNSFQLITIDNNFNPVPIRSALNEICVPNMKHQ